MGSPGISKVEGVVGTDFKCINYIEHEYEERYDTLRDPHETKNLAKDATHVTKLKALRKPHVELKQAAQ